MTKQELTELQLLLKKYLSHTNGVVGISKIKPCLNMVEQQLELIEERYYQPDITSTEEDEAVLAWEKSKEEPKTRQFHIYHATGKDRFTTKKVQPRQYVGFVNAVSLEKAFEYAQNDYIDWTMNEVRSTSVGDIIQDGDQFFIVLGMGFANMDEYTDEYAMQA